MAFEYKDGIVLELKDNSIYIESRKVIGSLPKISLEHILNVIDRLVDSVTEYFQTDFGDVYGKIGVSYLRIGQLDCSMKYIPSNLVGV